MNESFFAVVAPFATAVAIVFLVLTYQLVKLHVMGRRGGAEPREMDAREIAALADRAARMEQRIGHLEEILRESQT